jgi:hypothetical protein
VPGAVLFESPRRFQLWAQTVSHGQLLFRSPRSSHHPTRVEVLFKPVGAQKVRADYDGLIIRCAANAEAADSLNPRVRGSSPSRPFTVMT